MSLEPGSRHGVFEITARIGEGGMGLVYSARDTKLGRSVAIKVIGDSLSTPNRVARFEREARTLAALNHPNIAAIYGLEDAGGATAIVMELVEGYTLADRIAAGPSQRLKRSRWSRRSPKPSKRRTSRASSTGI
jgi:serine/threonine protein kinase